MAKARLVVVGGEGREGKAFPLAQGPLCTLGRGLQNAINLSDATVSETQCGLQFREGGWRLLNFSTTNGTIVNGVESPEFALADGDLIEVGAVQLRFVAPAAAPAPPASESAQPVLMATPAAQPAPPTAAPEEVVAVLKLAVRPAPPPPAAEELPVLKLVAARPSPGSKP